jgi:hypothetical protein
MWDGWRGAWEQGVGQYFTVLLFLILLPSGVAYFWGPGWGAWGALGALLAYFRFGDDTGLGELRWTVRMVVLNLLLWQLTFLLYLLNQLSRAGRGAG